MRGSPHCTSYSYADRGSQYVVHVPRVCRIRSARYLSRPGAGYIRDLKAQELGFKSI